MSSPRIALALTGAACLAACHLATREAEPPRSPPPPVRVQGEEGELGKRPADPAGEPSPDAVADTAGVAMGDERGVAPAGAAPEPEAAPAEAPATVALDKAVALEAKRETRSRRHDAPPSPVPLPTLRAPSVGASGVVGGAGGLGVRGVGKGGGGTLEGSSAGLGSLGSVGYGRGSGASLGARGGAEQAIVGRIARGAARISGSGGAPFYAQIRDRDAAPTGDFAGHDAPEANAPTRTAEDALSTFAVDVDTAAYSIARRTLKANRAPTASLVRVEELINYFRYDYDPPTEAPFSIHVDGARSPVDGDTHLLRVGIQARIVPDAERLPSKLVFLVDTSCSMTSNDKLNLAKRSLEIAVDHLGPKDEVAITTYAGGSRVVLPPTRATEKAKIKRAIRSLAPGGGTAMASGMELAYQQATRMLAPNTNTRVIVCSDGDANIGATSHTEILRRVRAHVSEGVRMSTIGFGDGNYKDATMEQLANDGNGNYFYIDDERMAQRVFGRDLTKMLQDVAEDVKIQVEFDPEAVTSYRLVGYENRAVADKDFRNDKVDAGEIGAGHQVTALYELRLAPGAGDHLATVRVRAKQPRGAKASEVERPVKLATVTRGFDRAPSDLRFATAVMGGAELLRRSPHASAWSFDRVLSILGDDDGRDPDRAEFRRLMEIARRLMGSRGDRISAR